MTRRARRGPAIGAAAALVLLAAGWLVAGWVPAAAQPERSRGEAAPSPPNGAVRGAATPEPGAPPLAPGEEAARPRRFPYTTAGTENAPLEARLDSILVSYGDGLPTETIRVEQGPDGPSVTAGDLGRIGGGGFQWNPETWRGSFLVDSLEVRFSLDSPVFWVGSNPVQAPGPVRYRDERLRLPLGLIDAVVAPILGPACRWDPATGRLHLAGRRPWLESLALEGSGTTAALRCAPIDLASLRLRWDPLGFLLVEGRGPHLGPGTLAVAGRADGAGVRWVRSTARGFEVMLQLDPRWAGVRLRADEGGTVSVVELTAQEREVARGRYEALTVWAAPASHRPVGGGPGRTILIELAPPPPSAGLRGDCLVGLATVLRQILEQEFGHIVVPVEDRGELSTFRSPAGLPETPGVPSGDCWVGLRLDARSPGEAPEFTLVVPGPVPHREPVGRNALESAESTGDVLADRDGGGGGPLEEIPPWGQVPRLFAAGSGRLARVMADHLDYEWEGRPVRIHARPSRIFRGIGAPAVLVYPAAATDDQGLRALCDSLRAADLARNLAFAIDEYLLSRVGD